MLYRLIYDFIKLLFLLRGENVVDIEQEDAMYISNQLLQKVTIVFAE